MVFLSVNEICCSELVPLKELKRYANVTRQSASDVHRIVSADAVLRRLPVEHLFICVIVCGTIVLD